MNMSPDPITAIFPVVIMNRRPRRKVVRQHSPRAAGADKIHHGVDNLPQIGSPRPAAGLGRWQERLDQVPLFICQIAWITPSVHISVIGQKVTFHTLSMIVRGGETLPCTASTCRFPRKPGHAAIASWIWRIVRVRTGTGPTTLFVPLHGSTTTVMPSGLPSKSTRPMSMPPAHAGSI